MSPSRWRRSDADAIVPVAIGTAAWAVVLVVLVLRRADLAGQQWWIGAAAVGVLSGVGGLIFLRWRRPQE